ncbi:MAG: SixA phosphatase family protein [bacterium]|jgi:phosphohistidine phosphatase SixA|nr:histidine phosphatase family protein [Phycisphaerales bacterium]MCE2653320.1 histidine phosphatase family protein [Planctomycetaceae bacterium]
MRLHIIRHGKAEQTSPDGTDFARPLRPRGVRQAIWLGQVLADGVADGLKAGPPPTVILASPVLRALNTAGIIARTLDLPVVIRPELSTSCDHRDVLGLLTRPPADMSGTALSALRDGSVAIVGHNPTFEDLIDQLRQPAHGHGHSGGAGPGRITLQTGMCVVLDFADARDGASAVHRHAGGLAGVVRLEEHHDGD